jgi:hypothetical protein
MRNEQQQSGLNERFTEASVEPVSVLIGNDIEELLE